MVVPVVMVMRMRMRMPAPHLQLFVNAGVKPVTADHADARFDGIAITAGEAAGIDHFTALRAGQSGSDAAGATQYIG